MLDAGFGLIEVIRGGIVVITVKSKAVSLSTYVSPPPATLAALITVAGASSATFNVTLMAGW